MTPPGSSGWATKRSTNGPGASSQSLDPPNSHEGRSSLVAARCWEIVHSDGPWQTAFRSTGEQPPIRPVGAFCAHHDDVVRSRRDDGGRGTSTRVHPRL